MVVEVRDIVVGKKKKSKKKNKKGKKRKGTKKIEPNNEVPKKEWKGWV